MKLDYKIRDHEGRLAYVKTLDITNATSYELEAISNYILQVAPRERQAYKVMTQKEYDNYYSMKKVDVDISHEEVLQMVKSESNDYCNTDWEITEQDINEESEMGDILKQYNDERKHVIKLMKDKKISIKKYRRLLANINDDMLQTKQSYKGVTERPTQIKWTGDKVDYTVLDYTNTRHIKAIIKGLNLNMDIEPNNVLSLIVEDMRVAIKVLYAENKIDKKDVAIVTGLNSRHTLEELQEIVGIQPSGISKRLTKVCKKVAEYFKNN